MRTPYTVLQLISRGVCTAVLLGLAPVGAQLASEIQPQGYTNYAVESFAKEEIENEVNRYFDMFGDFVINGSQIYSLESAVNSYRQFGTPDSVYRGNTEYVNKLWWTNFENLCITSDQIGGTKSAIMLGDKIETRFTPLTLNQRHFKGLRWDLWKNGLGLTTLLTRTRPDVVATRGDGSRTSTVYYNSDLTLARTDPSSGVANEDDWSVTSMFGDYDMFFALHGQKNIGGFMDLGVTMMNHHHNDVKNGESFFGEIPEDFAPKEIHFEFYDLTPENTDDPGARVIDVQMSINGQAAGGPHGVYKVDIANILRMVQMPNSAAMEPDTAHGKHPVVCTFYPQTKALELLGIEPEDIASVSFKINVAGNYLIFCSTEKFTPLYKHWGRQSDGLTYGPIQFQISDIVDRDITYNSGSTPTLEKGQEIIRSEVYFGEYIAKAPRLVSSYSNATVINYDYNVALGSFILGTNFNGSLYGVDFSGEVALNTKRSQYPTNSGEITYKNDLAWYVQATRPGPQQYSVLKDMYFRGDVYNISSKYEPQLPHYQVSRTFSRMTNVSLHHTTDYRTNKYFPHYMDYPIQLCNFWQAVDDNDDDDYYAENERKPYTSELYDNSDNQGNGQPDLFFNDGSHKSHKTGWGGVSHIYLPSDFRMIYEDYDGVIAERYDRNRNGELDYREDFLLFDSDPPVLALEADRNNNKVYDTEEDDMMPDYPYQLPYMLTSNGWRSLGVRGLKGLYNYVPSSYINVEGGVVYEHILDPDLDGESEGAGDLDYGTNLSVYSTGFYNYTNRDLGYALFAGQELKKVYDGIRNDAIASTQVSSRTHYIYKPDMLDLKDALVSNTALGVEYTGIKGLLATVRMHYGLEKHFAGDSIYVTQEVVADTILAIPADTLWHALGDTIFASARVPYEDKTINSFTFMAKTGYTWTPRFSFTGVKTGLNLLNRLEMKLQYKLMYEYKGSGEADPRLASIAELDSLAASDYDSLRWNMWHWRTFDQNNEQLLHNVPILRLSYKLGDKTYLEGGYQYKRVSDLLVSENSHTKKRSILQLRNKNTYQGAEITLLLGYSITDIVYDTHKYNPYYRVGSEINNRESRFYFTIYAGGF